MARGQKPGWSQSLERLATALVESNAAGASSSPTADREIATTRVFDAPRDLVWQAWTDPKHLARWYGPNGFTVTTHEMDVRPGGVWRLTMHGPDGTDYPNLTRYVEVVRPERLVYEHGSADRDEDRFDVTLTFTDEGSGKTRVSMRMVCATRESRDRFVNVFGALQGNRQTMDRLENHLAALAGGPKLVLTRTFDAPRDLWKAWTEAPRLSCWWGRRGSRGRVGRWTSGPAASSITARPPRTARRRCGAGSSTGRSSSPRASPSSCPSPTRTAA
ncbi:MAG: SRPBCC family protein [Acidobacteria bacterium]|nr:SRPBCC family protein [Acidobacteriota bacterium]